MTTLTWPAAVKPVNAEWWLEPNSASFTSPLSNQTQTLELPGARWRAVLTFDRLNEAKWRALAAFLASLRGVTGRFYYGPPHAAAARGVATGAPLINGAAQTGSSLITDGWTPGTAGILLAGDFVSYDAGSGRQLHLVTADASSDGAGAATLSIEPPIRTSPADNAPITAASPTCVMRLLDDSQGRIALRPPVRGGCVIEIVEAF